jgi:hypothetical protein
VLSQNPFLEKLRCQAIGVRQSYFDLFIGFLRILVLPLEADYFGAILLRHQEVFLHPQKLT